MVQNDSTVNVNGSGVEKLSTGKRKREEISPAINKIRNLFEKEEKSENSEKKRKKGESVRQRRGEKGEKCWHGETKSEKLEKPEKSEKSELNLKINWKSNLKKIRSVKTAINKIEDRAEQNKSKNTESEKKSKVQLLITNFDPKIPRNIDTKYVKKTVGIVRDQVREIDKSATPQGGKMINLGRAQIYNKSGAKKFSLTEKKH